MAAPARKPASALKPAPGKDKSVASSVPMLPAAQLASVRDLFWHNIVREILSGLIQISSKKPELLDGRFAILTHGRERIPIAQIVPLFGFTVRGDDGDRCNSAAVQLTVFRIATPDGEVFTLPVHEIRGFHELSPELLARLQQAEAEESRAAGEPDAETRPFGFAAFQALPKPPPPGMAPEHPTE